MATKVHMEALSPTMEEGRLVKWTKQEGDVVKTGDTLAEVETDKAVMELVARADGQLIKVMAPEGSTVPVGSVVAYIGAPGEKVDGASSAAPAAQPSAPSAVRSAPETQQPAPSAVRGPPEAPDNTRVKASPLAKRIAKDAGVDLKLVQGSGPGGRVVKRDLDDSASLRTAHAFRGRASHPDPQDDRQTASDLPRPHPPLLPDDRSGHGARRGVSHCSRGQGLFQRHRDQGGRAGADQAPRVQRLVPGRPHPLLERGAHRDGGGGGGWLDHTRDSRCRPQDLGADRRRVARARRAGAESPAQTRGVHRRDVQRLEPRHVRHRPVYGGD